MRVNMRSYVSPGWAAWMRCVSSDGQPSKNLARPARPDERTGVPGGAMATLNKPGSGGEVARRAQRSIRPTRCKLHHYFCRVKSVHCEWASATRPAPFNTTVGETSVRWQQLWHDPPPDAQGTSHKRVPHHLVSGLQVSALPCPDGSRLVCLIMIGLSVKTRQVEQGADGRDVTCPGGVDRLGASKPLQQVYRPQQAWRAPRDQRRRAPASRCLRPLQHHHHPHHSAPAGKALQP